jgi:hypothetical protein
MPTILKAIPTRSTITAATAAKKVPLATTFAWAFCLPALAQTATNPPLREYMMAKEAEVALAKSAAPANISDHASLKILTDSGYETFRSGDNRFVCMVLRGWAAPTYTPVQVRGLVYDATVRVPICFDPLAARTVLPYYELRSKLGSEGKSPDRIADAVRQCVVRLHVVGGSKPRPGSGPLASAHDGVRAVL